MHEGGQRKISASADNNLDDDEYVYYALKYGASGYLLKGGSMLNPGIVNKVVKIFNRMAQINFAMESDAAGVKELTRTERNIAHLVGHGLSNKEIADKLSLSEGTVRNSLSTALSKLNLRDRTQPAIWAVQTGLTVDSTIKL